MSFIKDYRISIQTDYPIAFDSHDHMYHSGSRTDNNTSLAFIKDVEEMFGNKPMNFMDFGCSGGLLVHDFLRRGHIAVGLEGSDYSSINKRAEWAVLDKKNLFTCDVSRDFTVWIEKEQEENKPFLCELITAWEVVEHMFPERLLTFFQNIRKHLIIGGKCCGTISMQEGFQHNSIYPEHVWDSELFPKFQGLKRIKYPFISANSVRIEPASFFFMLERTE